MKLALYRVGGSLWVTPSEIELMTKIDKAREYKRIEARRIEARRAAKSIRAKAYKGEVESWEKGDVKKQERFATVILKLNRKQKELERELEECTYSVARV